MIVLPFVSEEELLRIAAAKKNSERPLGLAIVQQAAARNLTVPKLNNFFQWPALESRMLLKKKNIVGQLSF